MLYKLALLTIFSILLTPLYAQEELTVEQLEAVVAKNREDRDQVDVLNILSERYMLSNPKKAEKYAEDAEKLATQLNYSEGLLTSYNNLGTLYAFHLKRHDKAIDIYEAAYLIYKQLYESDLINQKKMKEFMVKIVLNSYQDLANQSNLKPRDRRALKEYQQLQGDFAAYLAEFAQTTEIELKERETALDSAAKAIELMEGELDSTEATLTKKIAQKNRQIYSTRKSKNELSKEKDALFDSLILKEFMQDDLKDSLMVREIRLKDTRLKVLEEKSKVLSEQAKVNKLVIEKSRQKDIIKVSIAGGGLVLFTLIVIFISLRKQRKLNQILVIQKQELSELNEEINLQNEEILAQQESILKQNEEISLHRDSIQKKSNQITASINYAERIQRAILPSDSKIQKHLPESFVFFKPRDIVSGDFYWFNEVKGKIIFAAIDCTGHGVPGAFMSMVGNTEMNEIIDQRKIIYPDVILNEMNRRIQSSLQQDENKNRDGMDMSVCVIDLEAQELTFSGAKRPLVYIQNNELHDIKGERKSIGGQQKERVRIFSRHTISLKTPDNSPTYFYMFSDGFPDQFGNGGKRKFTTKKLKELLFEIHQLPLQQQKEVLSQRLDEWMLGNNEPQKQIDDILVIGFKAGGSQ